VHLSVQTIFPRTPILKRRGGKAKGRVRSEEMEGREWAGKKDEGEGKERRETEGREDSEGWCPQPKILATPLYYFERVLVHQFEKKSNRQMFFSHQCTFSMSRF
jgi:hypothetical protein